MNDAESEKIRTDVDEMISALWKPEELRDIAKIGLMSTTIIGWIYGYAKGAGLPQAEVTAVVSEIFERRTSIKIQAGKA